jgi:hypothetical protein
LAFSDGNRRPLSDFGVRRQISPIADGKWRPPVSKPSKIRVFEEKRAERRFDPERWAKSDS